MTAEGKPMVDDGAQLRAATVTAHSWWDRLEAWLEWAGDRLNPILVKETRQALKSRQFLITFGLLLTCAWIWSIAGMALAGPQIYYGAEGPAMFTGYYLILAFPLLIIVPFGAFRSLAVEREDRTYELLSISGLGPRQIVSGKLGSAVVQMLVYLSAISPCLAFTYMLRGIELPTILLFIVYTFLASLGLSLIALFIAALTTQRQWQVVLSVLLVAGLLFAFWGACALAVEILQFEPDLGFNEEGFWPANAAIQTAFWSYFAMVFFAAAAPLSFPSDNRSTRLRIVMLAQFAMFAGWMAWIWVAVERGDDEVPLIFLILAALHWYVLGALMTGESPELSPRVKRGLPQSFLGRVFLTWFNPGPGTGYLLACCGMLAAVAMAGLAIFWHEGFGQWQRQWQPDVGLALVTFGVLTLCYLAAYLGVGLLVIRALRKVSRVNIVTAALIHILLLAAGWGLPWVVHLMHPELRRSDNYNLLHVTDPFWSPIDAVDRKRLSADAPTLLIVVPLAALLVLAANLPSLAREVRHQRIARPRRVEEEDAQLAAQRAPPEPARTSPWD